MECDLTVNVQILVLYFIIDYWFLLRFFFCSKNVKILLPITENLNRIDG